MAGVTTAANCSFIVALKAESARIENKVNRLSGSYVDLDLLDERARDVLGFVRADELVIR